MWLAKCSYVAKLVDPYELQRGNLPRVYNEDLPCKGFGRYFFESWVYTHPTVRPCDLYPGREFTWAYSNMPDIPFAKEMRAAPRFDFATFRALARRKEHYNICKEDKDAQTPVG